MTDTMVTTQLTIESELYYPAILVDEERQHVVRSLKGYTNLGDAVEQIKLWDSTYRHIEYAYINVKENGVITKRYPVRRKWEVSIEDAIKIEEIVIDESRGKRASSGVFDEIFP